MTSLPIWFIADEMHSIGQWIVCMFEQQILSAYMSYKQNLKTKNDKKSIDTKNYSKQRYLKQNYASQQQKRQLIQKSIIENFMQDEDPKNINYKNRKNFHLQKCMQRLKQQLYKEEYLIQYNWYYQNKTNENFKIFEAVAKNININYSQWLTNKPFQEYQKQQQQQKLKKINKKRKKKQKQKLEKQQRLKQSQSDDSEQKKNQLTQKINQKINDVKQKQNEQNPLINNKHETIKQYEGIKINKIEIMNKQTNIARIKQDQTKTNYQLNIQSLDYIIKHKQKQGKNIQKTEKIEKKEKVDKKQQIVSNSNKKIIRERINEYYQSYVDQLVQASAAYDKYRRIVYQCVHEFIKTQIMQFHQHSKINGWKLEVYGSASAGFSLKHSDIDIVLLTDITQITLSQIILKLKLKQWAFDAKLIPAQIPLITFKISLLFSQMAHSKLTSKQMKKIENKIFCVDLTLAPIAQPHSGIKNTNHLKQIVQHYPPIRYICLFLKQLLRIRGLNKPYTGGVSSYVLIIMVYNILSRKNLIDHKKQSLVCDQYRMIKQISLYMQNQFKPFETIISTKKAASVKPDNTINLNVLDPKSGQLLKTSAFRINQVIFQLKRLRQFQQQKQQILQSMNINEKRIMKNYFIKQISQFMDSNFMKKETLGQLNYL